VKKWRKQPTRFDMKGGEHLRVSAEDYGAVGMKFMFETGNQELGAMISPKEIDRFRKWLSEMTNTEIAFMPPKAAAMIGRILKRDSLVGFLGGRERAVLQQCLEALEKAELIREDDNLAATKGRIR
jgi:hypothetical protein